MKIEYCVRELIICMEATSIQSSEVERNEESNGASLTGFTTRRMKGRRISSHYPLFPRFSLPFNVSGSTGYFRVRQQ